MQMIAGGALLAVLAVTTGQVKDFSWARLDARSVWSWWYLLIFGSIVGYTAYIWLLKEVSAAMVSTYSYVNPLIAVLLGWSLGGEPITPRIMAAGLVILGSVALITMRGNAGVPPHRNGTAARSRERAA
jgi:drug/metabolite transporter (DMT)-like permease